ncbi:hypothetical protein RRG08_026123 [Elysia crispata]|nr:hypothetical protein RRG08_026123 [Elysia crispata]
MGATSEKNFQCFLCSEKFPLATDLADHIENHNIQKAFQCGFCSESFHENPDILSHISSMHGGLPVLYNCSICKLGFQELWNLEEHVAGCQGNVTVCSNSGSLEGKVQFGNENIDLDAKNKTIKDILNKKSDNASERVLFRKICDEIFQTGAGGENIPKSEVNDGLDNFENEYTSSELLILNEESNQYIPVSETAKLPGNLDKSLKNVQALHLPNAHKLEDENMGNGTVVASSEHLDKSINHVKKSGVKKLCEDKKSNTSLISNDIRAKISTYISSKAQKTRSHRGKNDTQEISHISNKSSSFNYSSKQPSSGHVEKGFLCKICMHTCTSQETLEEHMRSHALEECYIIRCIKCNVCFDDAELLEKHLDLTNCSGFKCSECRQSFGLEALLLKHTILAHKQGSEMKCSECGKICSSQYAWARHEATHAKSQPYMCKICGKHLSSLEHVLRYHLPKAHKLGKKTRDRKNSMFCVSKISNVEKDENCDVQGKNDKSSFHKKRRVSSKPITSLTPKKSKFEVSSSVHLQNKKNKGKSGPKRWVCLDCDICGGKVSDHHALDIHRSYHFMEDKSVIHCSGCPEKFSQLADLTSHVQQKQCSKFKCEDCEQIFPTELSFMRHKSETHILPKETGFYSCLECQQNFESHSAYVDHSAEHVSSQPFQCKICNATFISEMLLEEHFDEAHTLIKNDQESNSFKCAQCLETFRTKMAITVHRRFHMQREVLCENKEDCHKPESSFASYMTPFFCEICSVGFSGAVQLERHEQLHSTVADKPKCHICGQIFQRNCYLKVHLGHHNRPFLCTACGKTFASSQTLKHHSLAYHSAVNPFQCQICHKFYSSKGALRHHMKGHLGEKRFECKICGKKFSDSTCLESHILNHSSEKRFKCKLCNYECRHRSVLSRHMDMHSGVKRYKCPHCGKRFRQQSGWKAHLTIHTGEKNFGCEYCGKQFARKDYLNVHLLTHTKEKPMICPICGDRFAVASNRNVHVRKVHGERDYKWFQEWKARNKELNDASVEQRTLPVQGTDAATTSEVPTAPTPLQNPIAPPDPPPVNNVMCPPLYPPPIYDPDNSSEHPMYPQTQQMFYW